MILILPILHACVRDWGSDYVLMGTKEFRPLPLTAQGPAGGAPFGPVAAKGRMTLRREQNLEPRVPQNIGMIH